MLDVQAQARTMRLYTMDAWVRDPAVLTDWVATRRRQLADGELVYIAHQLDFAGRSAE